MRERANRAARVVLPLPPLPTNATFTSGTDIGFHFLGQADAPVLPNSPV
jgi:hypothetical protein